MNNDEIALGLLAILVEMYSDTEDSTEEIVRALLEAGKSIREKAVVIETEFGTLYLLPSPELSSVPVGYQGWYIVE